MPPRAPSPRLSTAADPRRRSTFGAALVLPVLFALAAGCSAALRPVEEFPSRTDAREVSGAPASPAAESAPAPAPRSVEAGDNAVAEEPELSEGVFHRVEPGQTLWRIARAYGVDLQVLAKANGLNDPRTVETGRMLFVPGAVLPLEVAPFPAPPPPEGQPVRAHTPPPQPPADAVEFAWPVAGGEILSSFGVPRRHHRHAGLDIRGVSGQDVVAAARGEVAFAGGSPGGYGKLVILDHGGGLQTLYAHNSRILVRVGDVVERGQVVARVGRTGNATTDHCHFEVRKDKVAMDPLEYFPERALTATQGRAGTPAVPAAAGSSTRGSTVSVGETANR